MSASTATPTMSLDSAMLGPVASDAAADAAIATLTVERDKLRELVKLREEVSLLRRATEVPQNGSAALATIKWTVAEAFGVTVQDIDGRSRVESLARARHVVFFIARKVLRGPDHLSLHFIGFRTGKRDHGTVMCGCKRIQSLCDEMPKLAARVAATEQVCRRRLGLLEEGQEALKI